MLRRAKFWANPIDPELRDMNLTREIRRQRHQRVHGRLRRAISTFTRVFDAPSARLRASSTRYDLWRGGPQSGVHRDAGSAV